MTDDITIPPEALEAAVSAYRAVPPQMTHASAIRAACLAMLKAWPGMHIHEWQRPWLGGMSGTDITLPLPKENTNDKA